jgi:hypothetical protein
MRKCKETSRPAPLTVYGETELKFKYIKLLYTQTSTIKIIFQIWLSMC